MAALPAVVWCCPSMPASARFRSISCRWNRRYAPTNAQRAIVTRRRSLADGIAGLRKIDPGARARRRLFSQGGSPVLLDGDTLRAGLNSDLGFSAQDRTENIRRLAEVATHLARNGHIAIVAAVSPSTEDRAAARRIADTAFREIYIATSAEICESRDPKGHYAKARAGSLHAFTGIGSDYQPPTASELTIDTSTRSVPDATDDIEQMLTRRGILFDEAVDLAANISACFNCVEILLVGSCCLGRIAAQTLCVCPGKTGFHFSRSRSGLPDGRLRLSFAQSEPPRGLLRAGALALKEA